MIRGFQLLTRAFELATRGFEIVTRTFEFQLVLLSFQLVTCVLLYHFPESTSNKKLLPEALLKNKLLY